MNLDASILELRDWRFGGYLRQLVELKSEEFFDDDYPATYTPAAATRAGFCFGATLIVQLLDEDEHAALVERLKVVFADEIAILAEHHA
jgi:hypothetical protein